MSGARAVLLATWLLALAAAPPPCAAESGDAEVERLRQQVLALEDRIRALETGSAGGMEQRVRALEVERMLAPVTAEARPRVRISGSTDIVSFASGDDAIIGNDGLQIWDSRMFFEAELGRDLGLGGATLASDAALVFEWNVIRRGMLFNNVGDLFVELRNVAGSRWLNLHAGRFQIPIGEGYLRYGRGQAERTFISHPVSAIWFWDEGMRVFGSSREGQLGYVASLTSGEDGFNNNTDGQAQLTMKLYARPTPWLYLSASALQSGGLGSSTVPGESAVWFGEGWARSFGLSSPVVNYDHGVAIADGPSKVDDVVLLGGDAVLTGRGTRLWLSYGGIEIDSSGLSAYDRNLRYWLAELVVEGASLSRRLDPLQIGLRASGVGTYDHDRGYLLEIGHVGSLGYNMKSLEAYSLGLRWRMAPGLDFHLEYTRQDIDLVRGVTPALLDAADEHDYFGASFGVSF